MIAHGRRGAGCRGGCHQRTEAALLHDDIAGVDVHEGEETTQQRQLRLTQVEVSGEDGIDRLAETVDDELTNLLRRESGTPRRRRRRS